MAISVRFLLKGAVWTIGAYGVSLGFRLVTNVAMARLLAPELFGLMSIVYSVRSGIELLTDVGIGQNIIYSKHAEEPDFYNTAWTLQLIRSCFLWLLLVVLALPISHFYQSPILIYVLPVTAIGILFAGLTSVSRTLLQKRLQFAKLNIYDTVTNFIASAAHVFFALISPTIWALVFGGLFTSATLMIGSYFLVPEVRQRLFLSKQFTWQILHFGKWIFLSQVVYFLSTNFAPLYMAKAIPFGLLGVYGIARSISELLGSLVLRLSSYLLFPFVASHSHMPRAELRKELVSIRAKFMFLSAFGFSIFIAGADLAIKLLYDERYQAATWMLPALIVGSWFSMMANVNESALLGLGSPSYPAVANSLKFVFLLIGLPLGIAYGGLLGGIAVVTLAELCRYFPILVGQRREHFSFGTQDLIATLMMFLLAVLWEWLRAVSGFGNSFQSLPT